MSEEINNDEVMDKEKFQNGGPAFPTGSEGPREVGDWHYPRMTLRDYFAAKAMAAELTGSNKAHSKLAESRGGYGVLARLSYEIAEAMIVARSQK